MKIGKVTMNLDNYNDEDCYTDGEIEDTLLSTVKNHKDDREIIEILNNSDDWALLYHLSKRRENIIEWLNIGENENVLEIGSGCGAITGALAEKSRKVTCIELSKKRSMINAHRNDKYDNIEIMVGNFKDIELKEKFDYILVIGVLEYSELYMELHSDNAYKDFILKIKKLLKDKGRLVIAIENKFGLKYWAGCKEDHTGNLYEGVEGYLRNNKLKTFTKDELKDLLLNKCGFKNIEFYYPFPDYKLPVCIFSDKRLPKIGEINEISQNYDQDRILTFDEIKVYDTLIENNLFDKFSNSFLLICEN